MRKLYIIGGLLISSLFLSNIVSPKRVIDEQLRLGGDKPIHYIEKLDEQKIKQGESLIKKGWAYSPSGKKSKVISKHFDCTSCHNTQQEDPNLAKSSPESRLTYSKEHNIPFLQGTTLYGTVNREHWYNGDYNKKYGSLVIPAADTLANAIQLCAEVCSQGRTLEEWELESILHYLWTLDLKTDDLANQEYATLEELNSQFENASPATFITDSKEEIERLKGDPENGELIYELSCMYCHNGKSQVSELILKKDNYSINKLKKNLYKDSDFNLLHITRHGTKPHESHKPYMPHYTEERLSSQQLADLIAYISK